MLDLTPCSRVRTENITVAQLFTKFLDVHGIRWFITCSQELATLHQLEKDESTPHNPTLGSEGPF
jgi:hypothetical protein